MGTIFSRVLQAEAIPLILGGGDVLMAAETGSGRRLSSLVIIYRHCRFQYFAKLDPDRT